ncbi:hypothetical protein ACP70R_025174 [Stipagrostis hirtigluma subsp. patula]
MDPPQPPPRSGVDKYDFYYWLGCKILALGNSKEGKFIEALQDGDVPRLRRLVSSMGKKNRANVASINFDGMGLIHVAVHLGKLEVCRYFVEELGFDVDCAAIGGGSTPLGCAALFGEVAIARYLLDHGADPNKTDDSGSVPLHLAAKNGNEEMIRLLLSRGARVDIAISHGTPLHIAASYGLTGAMKILLEHHADPNNVSEVSGTPLVAALHSTKHGVTESDALECVKLLVEAGADVNCANPNTPMVVATTNGLTECIKYLLEAGADPNISNNQDSKKDEMHKVRKDRKAELKLHGEKAVKRKDYLGALKLYSKAIGIDRFDATLYSNRSLCYLKIGEPQKALLDAEFCIRLRPNWVKSYYRKGAALMSLKKYEEALEAFSDALELDPNNVEIHKAMREADEALTRDVSGGNQ